jgi:hypothetical protein
MCIKSEVESYTESPRVWRRAPDLSHTFVVDPVVA